MGRYRCSGHQPLVVVGGGDSACEEADALDAVYARSVYFKYIEGMVCGRVAHHAGTHAEQTGRSLVWGFSCYRGAGCEAGQSHGGAIEEFEDQRGEPRWIAREFLWRQCLHTPNTKIFKGVIDMDEKWLHPFRKKGSERTCRWVFVAGDCSDHVYRQAITAAGLGCAAAIDAERYLAAKNE